MLLDHDNLLSTFGKDSQSSNRKNNQTKQTVKNKRTCLNFHEIMQPKNKYEQILNQRKTLMLLQKKPLNEKLSYQIHNNKNVQRHQSKKLRTQTDIEYLNNKIRNSISGIAETICKSKINLNQHQSNKKLNSNNEHINKTNNRLSLTKKLNQHNINTTNNFIPARIQSVKQIRNFDSSNKQQPQQKLKSSRFRNNNNKDKQNVSNFINRHNSINNTNSYLNNNHTKQFMRNHNNNHNMKSSDDCDNNTNRKKDTLRNSTKKKGRFFQSTSCRNNDEIDIIINDCPIKSSYSIDLNSQHINRNRTQSNRNYINKIQKNQILYGYQNNRHQHSTNQRIHTQTISQPANQQNYCSKFQLTNNNMSNIKLQPFKSNNKISNKRQHQQNFKYRQSLSKKMKNLSPGSREKYQDTLKKQFKQLMLVESYYIQLPKLSSNQNLNKNHNFKNDIKNNNINSNRFTTRTTVTSNGKDSAKNDHKTCNNNKFNTIFQSNNYKDSKQDQSKYSNKNSTEFHFYLDNKANLNYHRRQLTLQSQIQQNQNQNFLLQEEENNLKQQNYKQQSQQKSPNFNSIQVPKKLSLYDIKKRIPLYEEIKQKHPLIKSFMQQIQLDYDLRHAKHMFTGIQQPFNQKFSQDYNENLIRKNINTIKRSSKWHLLNQELNSRGLNYSIQTIKKIFLPSQQELDPFLSVTQPHDELIHSLIYAYETAQIHWQQTIYKKWQHWDLREIDLTIENIDRERKGYITVEDIAAFISLQTGNEYKNRDVILIYKRLINNFNTNNINSNNKKPTDDRFPSNNSKNIYQGIDNKKLKFRSLIDCLIKNF